MVYEKGQKLMYNGEVREVEDPTFYPDFKSLSAKTPHVKLKGLDFTPLHCHVRPATEEEISLERSIKGVPVDDECRWLLKILGDGEPHMVRCAHGSRCRECSTLINETDLVTRYKAKLLNKGGYPIKSYKDSGKHFYQLGVGEAPFGSSWTQVKQ
jgi:hypothetical protein